jgi:hypothetical protein
VQSLQPAKYQITSRQFTHVRYGDCPNILSLEYMTGLFLRYSQTLEFQSFGQSKISGPLRRHFQILDAVTMPPTILPENGNPL